MHIIALNRHWIISWRCLLLTFFSVVMLIGLSVWQWHRAVEKTKILHRLSLLQQSGESSEKQLEMLTPELADGLTVVASAQWLSPFVWLRDNQIAQGRIGYDVIVPVRFDNTGTVMLINMGWVSAPLHRSVFPEIKIPMHFTVNGMVRTHFGSFRLGSNIENNGQWPMRIQQLDLSELKVTLPDHVVEHMYPGVLHQLKDSPYVVHYQPVVISPERHRAYALQWGLLAIVAVVIAVMSSLKKDDAQEKTSLNNMTDRESMNEKQ